MLGGQAPRGLLLLRALEPLAGTADVPIQLAGMFILLAGKPVLLADMPALLCHVFSPYSNVPWLVPSTLRTHTGSSGVLLTAVVPSLLRGRPRSQCAGACSSRTWQPVLRGTTRVEARSRCGTLCLAEPLRPSVEGGNVHLVAMLAAAIAHLPNLLASGVDAAAFMYADAGSLQHSADGLEF